MLARKINVLSLKNSEAGDQIVGLFISSQKEIEEAKAKKWCKPEPMLPIDEKNLLSEEGLDFNELEKSWSKNNHRPHPSSKNSTARVIRRPRGFGFEAIPIANCFAGCVDIAKKEAEKLISGK